MASPLLVNFHCHSMFSDGEQTPELLAANLAAAGVQFAALTDHDTLEGLPRFQEAARKRGLACLTGVELTTWFGGREAHLLGYGFDPQHPDLVATLRSLRQARDLQVHSIAGSLRKMGVSRPDESGAVSAAPDGRLEIGEAIDLLHRAGGKAFWAHPLMYESDLARLEADVAELKDRGLDGIEAIYTPFSAEQRADLVALAQRQGLLVSAGTDLHTGSDACTVDMPREAWVQFRAAIFAALAATGQPPGGEKAASSPPSARYPAATAHHFKHRPYTVRILLPTLIAIGLFLAAIWGIILPSFEQTLLDRKRELIRELTNSAWSILASYQRDEQNRLLTREQAQTLAAAQIKALRYGPERKDYFWIQDLHPRMIMHPYRSDLDGQDLRGLADPRGVAIFVAFADLVRREGEGYIDYVWQWKDDPARLEPKESYVQGFAPWGWVIGTGIYTDDVRHEIARIERSLVNTSLLISGTVVLLLVFVLQQSLKIEHERQEVLDSLRASTERYHSLVEATTEGALLILDGRCRYANPTFLRLTGYTARELEFLDLADLLPREGENVACWERLERLLHDAVGEGEAFEGLLRHAQGHLLECVLAVNPITVDSQRGLILLSRDIARPAALLGAEALARAAHAAPLGIFCARAARRATMLEMNPAARAFFSQPQPALADLFSDPAEFEALLHTLQSTGEVQNQIIHLESSDASARFVSLAARLVRDQHTQYIDGVLQDVTAQRKQDAEREALVEKLQALLLFLHQPLSSLGRSMLVCDLHTPVAQLARQMTERSVTAALVSSGGVVIGIVTDHDLRARALAEHASPAMSIHTVMSAPLSKISEQALIYEALMRMEEKGVRHLAVEDRDGQIVSVIDNKALIQFQRYGPIVLTREISRSATPEAVARHTARTPPLVKTLMDTSARPRHVTNMLASICDSATERLVQLAIDELGEPPVPFVFIAMGSQGREEQTLVTDQDNGIIFAPPADSDAEQVGTYFARLGAFVCEGLNRAGYLFCRGGVMASQARWCRSLPDWVAGFDAWVQKSEPQEIINLSIFFDFRAVYGDASLAHELRRAIHTSLSDQAAFFRHFAQNALMFKPPFRLLGNIYLSGGATEHAGEINLKDAMMPMVSFARLYALRHRVNQTHTLARIEALVEQGVIPPSTRDEISAAYDFLMQLRLQNHIAAIQAGRAPTNLVHPSRLGYLQQELLKHAFAQIAAVQKKVGYDFLGGVG